MHPQTERNEAICRKFKSDMNMGEIAAAYGVSRQRIQQILAREEIYWMDGGAHLHAEAARAKTREDRARRREARALRTYGCSYAEMVKLNMGMSASDIGSPAFKYRDQRRNAKRDGVTFEISFPVWVGIFERSGGISNRGLYANGLVLGRKDKSKGFTLDNVHVVTLSENAHNTRMQALERVA